MKKHLIYLGSRALGDCICAMPYLDLYSKKHKVEIHLLGDPNYGDLFDLSRLKGLFDKSYPNIKILSSEMNCEYEKIVELKFKFDKILQQSFAEALGFNNYSYIRPKMDSFKKERPIKNKYITFGVHSTFQMKYWNHPDGKKVQGESPYWNDLCRMFRKKTNLTPVCLSLDETFGVPPYFNGLPKKAVKKIGMPFEDVINYIEHSEFYIGLSSGMSWVAHALGKPVVMIANFTDDKNEFDLNINDYIRITNKDVCHSCFGEISKNTTFKGLKWDMCPKHQNTNRQFESHTSITPEYVFDEIKDWI